MGSPYFQKAVVHLENGKDLVVNASEEVVNAPYIKNFKVNGRSEKPKFLKYGSIKYGGVLDFKMSNSPQI